MKAKMKMTFAELFAGIGGFRLGLERAGMECVFSCEIDKFARQCYETHFDTNEFANDIREITSLPECDIVCAGWPCQDISRAKNNREGLSGKRSGLFYEIIRLLQSTNRKPQWVILENVFDLLNAERGLAMRNVLRELCQCGYSVQWRTFNAKYFRVAQSRRRVFIVGNLGKQPASEILFETKPGTRGYPHGKNQKTEAAGTFTKCSGGIGNNELIAAPLTSVNAGNYDWPNSNLVNTQGVRRLTPLECERLQGFPDNFTSMLSDTQRYNCLGNAVPPPMIEWIGRRIVENERCLNETNNAKR